MVNTQPRTQALLNTFTIYLFSFVVEGDRGAGTRENKGGRWAGSGRRWSGMRESCKGGRQEKNENNSLLKDWPGRIKFVDDTSALEIILSKFNAISGK